MRQGLQQRLFLQHRMRVQPLFELVEDQHQFAAFERRSVLAQIGERARQIQFARQPGQTFAQPLQQLQFGRVRRRVQMDGQHVLGQVWNQAGTDQR